MFSNFCSSVFYLLEIFIMNKNTRRPCCVSEKAYNCNVHEFSAVSFVNV